MVLGFLGMGIPRMVRGVLEARLMQMTRCKKCNGPHTRREDAAPKVHALPQKIAKNYREGGETTEYPEYAESSDLKMGLLSWPAAAQGYYLENASSVNGLGSEASEVVETDGTRILPTAIMDKKRMCR